jgi:hypothetical protein
MRSQESLSIHERGESHPMNALFRLHTYQASQCWRGSLFLCKVFTDLKFVHILSSHSVHLHQTMTCIVDRLMPHVFELLNVMRVHQQCCSLTSQPCSS